MDASALAEMQKEDDIDDFIANRGASKMDFTANYIRPVFHRKVLKTMVSC